LPHLFDKFEKVQFNMNTGIISTGHKKYLLTMVHLRRAVVACALGTLLFGCSTATAPLGEPDTIGSGLKIHNFNQPGLGSVNSWILLGSTDVAIIDTQRTLPEARALVAQVQALGRPVQAVVVTHEHPDHLGGLEAVVSAFPEASVWASAPTTNFIREKGPTMVQMMRTQFGFGERFAARIPVPTRLLGDGDTVQLAGKPFKVQQLTEGESSSMTLLASAEQRIVFVADLAGNGMTPWLVDGHVQAWITQLEAAQSRFAGYTVYPGHGAAGSAAQVLGGQLTYLKFFVQAVRVEVQRSGFPLTAQAKASIRAATEAAYPGYLPVAPSPTLIEDNADAVAAQIFGGKAGAAQRKER
jgi:glyoxylase-like metal-dependent hydrolase (beta-lactamase superfamily II)